MRASTDEPKFWNIWWTLTVISAVLTIIAGLLEALGVWHDVGLGVSVIGLVATIVGAATAATRTSIIVIGRELSAVHDILSHSLKVQNHMRDLLERLVNR